MFSAKVPPHIRTKPVFAAVKAMRSDRTRCCEEIQMEALKSRGALAMGVTFNAWQIAKANELKWVKNHQTALAFMIIARRSSSPFHLDLGDRRNLVTTELPRLKLVRKNKVERNILEVISQGKDVDDDLVIIDDFFKVGNGQESYDKDEAQEVCSILTEAVLDPQKMSFSNWWWRCTEEDERLLLLVAAYINSLPGAVEIAQQFLTSHSNRPQGVSEFMTDLSKYVQERLTLRYIWHTFPNNNILFSMLCANRIELDFEVEQLVACSILLNCIETFLETDPTIVPVSSLPFLAGCQNQKTCLLQLQTIQLFKDLLQEMVDLVENGSKEGILFEAFVAHRMRYRWNVVKISFETVCLGEILGIQSDRIKSLPVEVIKSTLSKIFTLSNPIFTDFEYLIINSYEDPAGHLKEVSSIIVNATNLIAARRGAKNDKYDLLIVIYQGEGLKPLLLYIDHKSPSPNNPTAIDKYYTDKDMHQYRKVKSMCDAAGVPFIYCYWTHYPGSMSIIGSDCFVLREEESKSFFGTMWPIFTTCRSLFDDK